MTSHSSSFFNAEDGTWTHTSAMLTRSLVLLVCQFRHFRISHFCYKFYLLLRQLVLYQKLYKLSIAFLNFFYFYVFLSFLLSIDSKIIYNRKSICNCLFHSNLAKIHSRLPAAMEFWLVCLGILAYSCQNTSRDSGVWTVTGEL